MVFRAPTLTSTDQFQLMFKLSPVGSRPLNSISLKSRRRLNIPAIIYKYNNCHRIFYLKATLLVSKSEMSKTDLFWLGVVAYNTWEAKARGLL